MTFVWFGRFGIGAFYVRFSFLHVADFFLQSHWRFLRAYTRPECELCPTAVFDGSKFIKKHATVIVSNQTHLLFSGAKNEQGFASQIIRVPLPWYRCAKPLDQLWLQLAPIYKTASLNPCMPHHVGRRVVQTQARRVAATRAASWCTRNTNRPFPSSFVKESGRRIIV